MMRKINDIASRVVVLYFMHFGNKDPDLVTCRDCCDYCLGFCYGGADDVLGCMLDKAERCEVFTNLGDF